MKAFEEYHKKIYSPELPEIATDLEDWCEYQGTKRGWRAALEWVKLHHVELGIEDWTIINEELEDTE